MALVHMQEMLRHAYRNGYAIGAFDLVSLDFLAAIIEGAEACRAPVILSLAESHFDYFDFDLVMPAVETAAQRCSVPVAIHLDHGVSLASAVHAINLGCNGVMVDASNRHFRDNVALTGAVAKMAHACGVAVEGELGYVAGVEGEDAERHPGGVVYTSVEEARDYVAQTGVDCLAVSIGTVHGRMRGTPELDFERLAAINMAVHVPLVIHGGTGLDDGQFRRLIENGVAKINYYTALSDAAAGAIRGNLGGGEAGGYTGLMRGVQQAIRAEVERCIRLWGGADRAAELLSICRPWRMVEHVIQFNTDLDGEAAEAMMAEGRASLAAIPGVRAVVTGEALQAGARYHHAWLVRFAHEAVVESYRANPAHVHFADQQFRPHAADRLSIDYRHKR